jgi:hypothetical protein
MAHEDVRSGKRRMQRDRESGERAKCVKERKCVESEWMQGEEKKHRRGRVLQVKEVRF